MALTFGLEEAAGAELLWATACSQITRTTASTTRFMRPSMFETRSSIARLWTVRRQTDMRFCRRRAAGATLFAGSIRRRLQTISSWGAPPSGGVRKVGPCRKPRSARESCQRAPSRAERENPNYAELWNSTFAHNAKVGHPTVFFVPTIKTEERCYRSSEGDTQRF